MKQRVITSILWLSLIPTFDEKIVQFSRSFMGTIISERIDNLIFGQEEKIGQVDKQQLIHLLATDVETLAKLVNIHPIKIHFSSEKKSFGRS